jgi:ATP-dependent DNA helicase RecG
MVPVFPMTAIREIIANALIHQDFTISGVGPVVEIYADRIEVTNPGNSLIELDRIIDERRSRNEKLAGTMRSLGICEERGGGIDKAIIEIEELSLPAPEFIASENTMRVVVFGQKPFEKLSKGDKIWACFCHCVVRWLRHDYMSNTTLRERFSLAQEDYQAVSAVISDARKAERIVPAEEDQGKRNARYVPYWAR